MLAGGVRRAPGSGMPMRRNDVIHLGLMLSAFAAAYLVPFELLLLAYVVLGPAHYFTEISWLHDQIFKWTELHFQLTG